MKRLTALVILLASSNLAWCADPVGRIILAAGEVEALRGGKAVPLIKDTSVEIGDEIRTGKASSVQIRFADASIVALREETTFRVDDFAFRGEQDGSERAFFRLLKGGLRTITGAIGRLHKQNYGVVTPTSTIGIRGTHYNLVVCDGNCRNTDGSIAPSGTYGGVTDGRISSTPNTNPAATREFAKGEFFFSPNASAPPQPLLVPPAFLADKLEAQKRSASPAHAAANSAATAGTKPGSGSTENATSTPANGQTQATATDSPTGTASGLTADVATTNTPAMGALPYVATEALTSSGTPAVINAVTGFIAQYYDGTKYIVIDSCGDASGTCPLNSASQFSTNGTWLTGYSSGGAMPKGSIGSGTVVDTGSIQLNGHMFAWGRWTGDFSVTDSAGKTLSNLPSGVLFGLTDSPTVNNQAHLWPASGMVSYTLVGGPSPIDTSGNTGTMTSMSGTLDFVTRNVTFNANLSIAIPTQGMANLTMSGSGTIASTNDNLIKAPLTTTCSGGGCAGSIPLGQFDTRFAGAAAQVMVVNGLAPGAVKNSSGLGTNSVLFLNVLKCTSGC